MAGAAVMANPTPDREVHSHIIAFAEFCDSLASLYDDTCGFVTTNKFVRVSPADHSIPVVERQIRPADTAGFDFNQYLIGARFGDDGGSNFDLLVSWQVNGGHF
jgi:hypothetical protein